jgi:gliding motility-associated-like protein
MPKSTILRRKTILTLVLITCVSLSYAQTANFTANLTSGCSPLVISFQDQSTGSPIKYNWNLGNGATSTLQNPSTTYIATGTYTITLTTTYANGSTNTQIKTNYITVYNEPTIDFTADKTTGCFPAVIQFKDLSTTPAGTTINGWKWDFGDGNTSDQQNPKYVYRSPGNYTVIFTVSTDKGCKKVMVKPNFITVSQGVSPSFSFSDPSVCRAPATVNFTNNSTGPGTLSYNWTFGDGSASTTTQNPSHSFNVNGTYHVSMTVSSDLGCTDSSAADLPIGKVNTDFIIPAVICPKTLVTFNNNSSPRPISTSWVFSNGTTDIYQNGQTVFATAGNYSATVINKYSVCTDTLTKSVKVGNAPVLSFSGYDTVKCQPSLTTNFTNTTNASSFQWNFGDGGASTQANPSHTYTNFGTYNVTLIAKDSVGCSDTLTKTAYIKIAKPVITFPGLPAKGCIPLTVDFAPNVSAVDTVKSYLWDFGDGGSSTLAKPSHVYSTQGTYTVKLTITTSSGCTEVQTMVAAVKVGSLPTANFTSDLISACADPGIHFINQSTNATEYLWDFGDGTTASDKDPQHTFSTTGPITVTLTAINNGCENKITKTNYATILPSVSKFDYRPDCANPLQFTFTDMSLGASTWNWDFGDGTTFVGQTPPVHNFPAAGSYNVSLKTTSGACTYTLVRVVTIANNTPNFTVSPSEGCKPFSTTFTAAPPNAGLIKNYEWDFGDGSPVSTTPGASIAHLYSLPGSFTVKLTTIDSFNCRHEFSKTAVQVNGPIADFTSTTASGCKGMKTTFNDASTTDGTNAIVKWSWNYGDGSSQTYSTLPPFVHQYDSIDHFDVKLVVTDAKGCMDSVTKRDFVKVSTLNPAWSFSNASCPGSPIGFINKTLSDLPYTSVWNFGDSDTAKTQDAIHAYADTGLYTLSLVVTDLLGCTDSLKKIDTIHVAVPKADFTANNFTTYCTPFEAAFTNQSYFYNNSLWDLQLKTSTATNPSLYYTQSGTYPIKLVVTSPGGCKDSITKTLEVHNPQDGQLNYSPLSGCTPMMVNFDAFSKMIGRFIWDFGDGNVVDTTINQIDHRYLDFGSFVPKVILKEPSGICVVPLTGAKTIDISGVKAKYTLDKMLFCDSGYITVTDSTTYNDPIRNYEWDFGDGSTYNIPAPVHHYTTPGTYTVSLVVNTQRGCTDTLKTGPVKVVQSPMIGVSPRDTAICLNDALTYLGLDLRPDTSAANWRWSLNGKTFNVQNPPTQQFVTAGNFKVNVVVTNSSGCIDTATRSLLVNPLPQITLPASLTKVVGVPLTLPAAYSKNVSSILWTPSATLSCPDCPQPVATPKFNTKYNVAVVDSNGCKNNTTINVIVTCQGADIFVPNTFSPNGDGSNDVLYVRGKGLDRVKSLRIFNRWGQVVFEQQNFPVNDPVYGWDGKFKGSKPLPGVYVYQVEIFCENSEVISFEGNIALIQ